MTNRDTSNVAGRADMGGHRSLVFTLGWETLQDVQRRNWARPPDRLILELLGERSLANLIVAEPPRNPVVGLGRSPWERRLDLPISTILPGRSVVTPYHFGMRRPQLYRTRFKHYARSLRRAAMDVGASRLVVVTTDPRVAAFADFDFAERVLYFARDDWAVHPSYRSIRAQILKAYALLRDRQVSLLAVSDVLLARLEPTAPSAVLPNGVEPSEWITAVDPPEWFAQLSQPRFVYVGTIDSRIDVEWIARLSDAVGEASIVLAGPNYDEDLLQRLSSLRNVVLPGRISTRHEIVSIIRASDLCLIPHVKSALTEAMDPLKLYEYLAAGRPVVATDLGPLRRWEDRVILVGSPADVPGAVQKGLQLGPASERDRMNFVNNHSWTSRAKQLLDFAYSQEL